MKKIIVSINIFLLIICIAFLLYCSKEKSSTDISVISKVNTYITKKDVRRGIKRTTNSISHVTFSHKTHAKTKCITCHHKFKNDARVKVCAYCHKGLHGAEVIHSQCIECHRKNKQGPQKCSGCHIEKNKEFLAKEIIAQYKQTFTYNQTIHNKHTKWGISCKKCHHRDHKDTKVQKCSACHKGRSQMKIMHYFCKDCHKGNNRLKKQVGPITCSKCHLKK